MTKYLVWDDDDQTRVSRKDGRLDSLTVLCYGGICQAVADLLKCGLNGDDIIVVESDTCVTNGDKFRQ